jgi:hypothetical protein
MCLNSDGSNKYVPTMVGKSLKPQKYKKLPTQTKKHGWP